MENPLWAYSLAQYRRAGVERACLQLQDRFDLDVNLLLYAAWLASHGQKLTQTHLGEVNQVVAQWRGEVIRPLRQLRRGLKSIPGAQEIRGKMAELELEAEAQQQALMFACHQNPGRDSATQQGLDETQRDYLFENLAAVAAQTSVKSEQWQPLVAQLQRALMT